MSNLTASHGGAQRRAVFGGQEVNAAVFYGDDREFLVLPYAKNAVGARTGVNMPERLGWDGISEVALGEKVLKALQISAVEGGLPLHEVPAFTLATGLVTFRDFAKTRQQVFVQSTEDNECIRVRFLHRNASYVFAAQETDPPDWTVVLPVDSGPEVVGSAVIQVLRAGGVDIVSQDAHGSGDPVAGGVSAVNDRGGYVDFEAALLSDYRTLALRGDGTVAAVTRLLEENGPTVCEDPVRFHCALVTSSLICLNEGFLPDYLDEPVRNLGDVSCRLSGRDLSTYREDLAALRAGLATHPVVVVADFPPDYFPGTWGSGADSTWWDDLLRGVDDGVARQAHARDET